MFFTKKGGRMLQKGLISNRLLWKDLSTVFQIVNKSILNKTKLSSTLFESEVTLLSPKR